MGLGSGSSSSSGSDTEDDSSDDHDEPPPKKVRGGGEEGDGEPVVINDIGKLITANRSVADTCWVDQ